VRALPPDPLYRLTLRRSPCPGLKPTENDTLASPLLGALPPDPRPGLGQQRGGNPSSDRGVVVNFDLGERFPRPRSQQRGQLAPCSWHVAVLWVCVGPGCPLLLRGSMGVTHGNFFEIFDATFGGNLGQKIN